MKTIPTKISIMVAAFALAAGCSREPETADTTVLAPVNPTPAPAPGPAPTPQPPATNIAAVQELTSDPDASEDTSATGTPAASQSGQSSSSAQQPEQVSRSSRYLDFQVLDQQDQTLGQVETVWDDSQGEPAYIGIKQPNQEKLAILPADLAQVNESRRTVRLSVSQEAVQSAPALEQDGELDEQFQQRVQEFQRQHTAATQAAQPGATNQNQATIRLKQEQATIGKRTVESGGVVLRKVVRTETNREPVTLRREELVIERVPGGGQATNANFAEQDIFIPLRREVPVVEKSTVVKETVRVGKDLEQERATITTPVREEHLQIQRQGRTEGTGAPGSAKSGRGSGESSASEEPQSQTKTPQ